MSDYKISVIIPVYNVEKYLDETLKSIVKQTIGFNNIQVILVNDGSKDNSEKICLEYKEKYPNNITYVKKENGGVSSARNEGIKHVKGKYTHFLDSDDYISEGAYKKAYDILENNSDVSLCALRLKFFEKSKAYHYMDYRFKNGDRIVDLEKNPNNPVLHNPTTIVRSEYIKNKKFDVNVKISEDFKFLAEVICEHPKIAFIASELYYYRKRFEENSAIQTSLLNKDYYFVTPVSVYEYILKQGKKHPKADKWAQYCVVNDLNFRLFNTNFSILNDKEKKEYTEEIRKIYKMCDDDVIATQINSAYFKKIRALEFKYKKPICDELSVKDGSLYFKNTKILSSNELQIKIDVLEIKSKYLNITGRFDLFLNNCFNIYIKNNNEYIKCKLIKFNESDNNIYSRDNKYYISYFNIDLELDKLKELEFFVKINNEYLKLNIIYQNHSKLNELPHSYYKKNGYVITHKNNKIIVSRKSHFNYFKYLFDVLLIKKDILLFGFLIVNKLLYPFMRHDNWIVADRYDVAGDNGEWMFKYLNEKQHKKNVYFALRKNSPDIPKMKNVGKLLYFNTIKYYIKYMYSEVVISSHVDDYIRKPFGKKQLYLSAFLKYKFVFLQHGVTKNDMSNWLYKPNKNIDILVCSANMEYNEFLQDRYMYSKDVIKLTGMPRYDNLYNAKSEKSNIIAFMPTWRNTLCGAVIPRTQNRRYNDKFKDSEYFKFYNGLINDKRLIDALKKHDCKILFCLHPSFTSQLKDFENNEYVTFKTEVYYPDVFKKAKLMLTDYSSVAFDFGYTKKPVVYSQFDKDHLYQIHTVLSDDGEFSYENDGFGKVTYTLDDTVNTLVNIINNDFKNDKKYEKRVDKFFKYQDNKNCKRVYDEIIQMLNKDK